MRQLHTRFFATAAIIVSCYPCYASAQAPAAEQASAGGIEEVVVTAQKRSENLQRVPIAVSAISSGALEFGKHFDVDQLVSLVPALNVNKTSSGAQPFIRGIGTNTSGMGVEPAVATYVDGVYYPSPAGSIFSFNNLERIEVLKGPQGTLFGRNAAGGVVNIITRDPTAEPAFRAEVGYGNYNTFTGNLYASHGITDNLAGDIAVYYSHQGDGWGKTSSPATTTT